jgi:lipoprotein-anchoring transpeptidase ErfK/SrfK
MTKHRAGPAHKRRARAVNRHRAAPRPRYGRIATLVSSLAVTVTALLGGTGLLPSSADDTDPAAAIDRTSGQESVQDPVGDTTQPDEPHSTPLAVPQAGDADRRAEPDPPKMVTGAKDTSLPADSGEGRRIVFSQSLQRVWLVDDAGQVLRTYPVSGSIYDNLDPGLFSVYSRSEHAVGIDNSGTMQYFVRFTKGDEGAAIGFHDIPVDDGQLVQTVAQLGIPLSHGCIRQERADAIALWEFAPIGTTVVVTA